MRHTPAGDHPPGWDVKLADRSSLPPVPGEERARQPYPYQADHNASTQNRYYGGKGHEGSWGRRQTAQMSGKQGWDPEGSSGGTARSPSEDRSSPPSFLRWARTLHDLLQDAEGVRMFQAYVRNAGILHSDRLDFYFACQGLKQQTEQAKVKQMVGAIYKFLRKSQLTTPEDVKRVVKAGLKEGAYMNPDVFDNMQQETERLINETTYPSFLRSETYIQHVRLVQQAPSHSYAAAQGTESFSSGSSSSGSREQLCSSKLPMALATLHEGEELTISQNLTPASNLPPQRLTKDLLMATQKRRLQPETFSGGVFGRKYSVYSYPHMAYSAYCPASRQDSELQSLSSGRTDSDARSMSGSSLDGMSIGRGNSGWSGGCGGNSNSGGSRSRNLRSSTLDSATINRDPHIHDMVIPRTLRILKDQCRIMKPDEFAVLLIEKLEKVKRDIESQEKLDRKLMENDADDIPGQAIPPRMVAAALREKLQLDDDNDQDILDQHVSRVWADLTPLARSPGGPPSPAPSPPRRRGPRRRPPHPHPHPPRDAPTPSVFSADSGNVRDLPPPRDPPNRSASKKTLNELTDSGVSVVSDVPLRAPRAAPLRTQPAAHPLDTRVLAWIHDHPGHSTGYEGRSYRGSRASSSERGPAAGGEAPAAARVRSPPRQKPDHCKRSGWSKSAPSAAEIPSTVVVFTFLDEQVPYRTKIPAAPVTLKQFKEYLPKKGNYRYFFKTECEDLDNRVIQEEIFNDTDLLPLWEGKIMARVKNSEQ